MTLFTIPTLNKLALISVFAIALTLGSCVSPKKIIYFNEGAIDSKEALDAYLDPRIEVGDILAVEVTGIDPEIVAPFNQAELVHQGNQLGSYDSGVPATYGYLVSPDSTINLPIVGKVQIAGLPRNEAVLQIEDILSEYLKNPSVSIRILNFKITVLGEVERPGTFSIPNERVSIIEALGIAKDLKITGERKNILVIRHEKGERKEFRLDLTSNSIFDSPAYYLKQNDVVYVQPNRKARYDASLLKSSGGVIISTTSLIISTLILIFN